MQCFVREIFVPKFSVKLFRPIIASRVAAGFPSPADDYIEKNIDLNEWMIGNEIATYIVRVSGNSMDDEIHSGDRLVVDRSLEPRRRLRRRRGCSGQTTASGWD